MFTVDNWITRDLGVAALQGDWKNPCCMDELDPHLTSCVGAKPFLPSLPPPWWFLVENKESCTSRIYNVQTRVLFLLTERGAWLLAPSPCKPTYNIFYCTLDFLWNLLSVNSLCVAVPSYPKEEGFVSSFHISLGGGGEGEGMATSRPFFLEYSVNIQ